MPFEYRTICKLDNFWPFEYWTSLVFRWLLYLSSKILQDDIALRRALTRAKLLKRRANEEDAGARIIAQINATSPTEEESVNGTTGAGKGTCFNDVTQIVNHFVTNFGKSGVLTQGSFLRRISKLCDLSRVEA